MNFQIHELVVLQENRDNYEPSSQQIYDYGEYLGLIFPQDQKFLPMLYEALKAPLPQNWQACEVNNQSRDIVYRNKLTNEVQEEHPLDRIYSSKFAKIKSMTAELAISAIAEETESWLRDSKDSMRNSSLEKNQRSLENSKRIVDDIAEEQSFYEVEDDSSGKSQNIRKPINSARTYRKKNVGLKRKKKLPQAVLSEEIFQEKLENLKNNLNSYWPEQIITLSKIERKELSCLTQDQHFQQLLGIERSLQNIKRKETKLSQLGREKEQKLSKIKRLKEKLKQ